MLLRHDRAQASGDQNVARVKPKQHAAATNVKQTRQKQHAITFEDYLECLCAVHLASYVDWPFKERSGVFVVGPPSVFKTTFLEIAQEHYSDAIEVSDLNVQSLVDLRDQMASNVIRSLVIPDFGKLYERHPSTAKNLEGHVRALAGEGFAAASFEDSRQQRLHARCTIMSAMTPKVQGQNFGRWEDTGFARRFLWSLVTLEDPTLQTEAVIKGELLDFGMRRVPTRPVTGQIPMRQVTLAMRRKLLETLQHQPGGGQHATQLSLLARMLAVLSWHYRRTGQSRRSALKTVLSFARSLGSGGAVLTLQDRRNGR